MQQAIGIAKLNMTARKVNSVDEAGHDPNFIDVLDDGHLDFSQIRLGEASAACGKAAMAWRKQLNQLVESGQVHATVGGPSNSDSMRLAGREQQGDDEGTPGMEPHFNFNGRLRIVGLTEHRTIREVIDYVKKDRVLDVIEQTHNVFEKYGVRNPRIGVSGLNPHAHGAEDENEIAPAVREARERGIDAIGPKPPDSIFWECLEGVYDVVVCMTHDQRNIALKTRGIGQGTVSASSIFHGDKLSFGPNHGTAYNIVGKGIANHASMLAAIKTAATFMAGKGFPQN
jgi:4-hydroxythreonine-4-phosphate dehydrogenase